MKWAICFKSLTNERFWQYKEEHFLSQTGILATVNYYQYLKDKILEVEVSNICNVKDYIYHELKVQGKRGERSLNLHRMIVNTLLLLWKVLILDSTSTFY